MSAERTTAPLCEPAPCVSVAPVEQREIWLHGHRVTYLETGAHSGGPVVVLLHGLASSSSTWRAALPGLGQHAHVIAPDLLGHGESAKPRSGDYSLGAYAAGLRDLLVALGRDRVTVVGHSFGGGVAMQFAYQFPEFTERLVLVSSGGLGQGVSIALRAATLPGTAIVLQAASAIAPGWIGQLARQVVRALPVAVAADFDELARALAALNDHGSRGAFVQTIRSALAWSGQRLDGTARLYLLAEIPVLFVGGRRDSVIPVGHTVAAHAILPTSRLELLDTGHCPHAEQPEQFDDLLLDFLATTRAAWIDMESLRQQLLGHPGQAADRYLTPVPPAGDRAVRGVPVRAKAGHAGIGRANRR